MNGSNVSRSTPRPYALLGPVTWRGIVRHLDRPKRTLAIVIGGGLLTTVLTVPMPILLREVFDTAIPNEDRGALLKTGLLMVVLFVLAAAIEVVIRRAAFRSVLDGSVKVRRELHDVMARADVDELAALGPAGIHDVVATNVSRVETMVSSVVVNAIPSAIISLGLTVFLLVLDWRLVLVASLALPPVLLVTTVLGRRSRNSFRTHHEAFRAYSDDSLRAARFVPLTRSSAAEQYESDRLNASTKLVADQNYNARVVSAVFGSVLRALVSVAATAMLVVGALFVVSGQVSPGRLIAFFGGVALLRTPGMRMVAAFPQIAEGVPSLAIVQGLRELELGPQLGSDDGRQIALDGSIKVDDVSFTYHDDEGRESLLRGINLELAPGRITVLMGANGAGKSTLVSLIMGLRTPTSGRVLADGVPYDDLDLRHLRRQMAVVLQEALVDEGRIAEIIGYGLDAADRESIIEAGELADADVFVQALDHGYDTEVSRIGHVLSMGQHQRLSIARALARRARVVILDEPTNHLDPHAINHILKNLQSLENAPAILIVSHHAEVADWADEVITI